MKSKFNKIMTDVVKFSAIRFAQECRNMNTIEELQAEYIWALEAAIYAIQNYASIGDDGRIPL